MASYGRSVVPPLLDSDQCMHGFLFHPIALFPLLTNYSVYSVISVCLLLLTFISQGVRLSCLPGLWFSPVWCANIGVTHLFLGRTFPFPRGSFQVHLSMQVMLRNDRDPWLTILLLVTAECKQTGGRSDLNGVWTACKPCECPQHVK